MVLKSAFDLHCELDKRFTRLRKRREWIERNGEALRDGLYLGTGLILAGLIVLIETC